MSKFKITLKGDASVPGCQTGLADGAILSGCGRQNCFACHIRYALQCGLTQGACSITQARVQWLGYGVIDDLKAERREGHADFTQPPPLPEEEVE